MSLLNILNDGEGISSSDSGEGPDESVSRDTPSPTAEWQELSRYEMAFAVLRHAGEVTYDPNQGKIGGRLPAGDNGYPTLAQLFGTPGGCLDAAISLSRREAEKGAIGLDRMPRRITLALEDATDPQAKRRLVYEIATELANTGNYRG
jgi:hypothetical protein